MADINRGGFMDFIHPIDRGGLNMRIKQGDTVLFQGDSITDAGRVRDVPMDLGRGYTRS
ncbi:hypothetical protein J2X61_003135 [Bacillus sp. 3255]|nr:hypothetical protein [Bacillus sp. 3255]